MEQEMKVYHDNFEDGPDSGLFFGELSLHLGEELEIVWDLGYLSDRNDFDGVVCSLSGVKNFIEQRADQSYYEAGPVTIELDEDLVIFTYEMPSGIQSKYRTRSVVLLLEDLIEFFEDHEILKKEATNARN